MRAQRRPISASASVGVAGFGTSGGLSPPQAPIKTSVISNRNRTFQVFQRRNELLGAASTREIERLLEVRLRLLAALPSVRNVRERSEDARAIGAAIGHVERFAKNAFGVGEGACVGERLAELPAEDENGVHWIVELATEKLPA